MLDAYTGYHFAGGICYADDVAPLAPSPAALRIVLVECERFAAEFPIFLTLATFRPTKLLI